jgi:PAS domain S-box-containing protein
VFDAMLASAARLCGVQKGDVAIRQGEVFRHVAFIGATPDELAWLKSRITVPARGTSTARALLTRQIDHVLDQSQDPERIAPKEATAARTTLAVPLLRDGEPLGVISLLRDRVEAFSERQITLIRTFADQSVIAMENARLLSELRESLDQQIATAEILQVINTSPGNLTPVFQAILEKAHSTCGADMGSLFTWDGTRVRALATLGYDPDIDEILREPHPPTAAMVELMSGQRIFHRVQEQDRTAEGPHPFGPRFLEGSRIRTNLIIPLRKDDVVLGFISANRREVRPYSDKEIALLENFAAQAVIAMENARLLGELTRREEELRVTFDHMGDGVVMFDADLRLASWNRNFQELLDVPDSFVAGRPGMEDYVRLLVGRGELGQGDAEAEVERYRERVNAQWSVERERPDGRTIEVRNNPVPGGGAVLIYSDITERKKAEAEIRAARDAAEGALDKLKAAQANLVQSEKMASLGQLTAGIAHEIKNPLNFVNNFAALSVELLDELKQVAGPALETLEGERRAELDETMALLVGNLDKIAEHGKRADGIVKSMLSHSRGGAGDWAPSDINALVEEALNLAYHGARAQDKEFNIALERDFAKESAPIEVVPQDVMRVFLNLFGNGFYAANKRRLGLKKAGFRPTLKVSTRDLGDRVEIKVRDNGIGISPDVREKLFQPFFTTKPTGEGTGLGLSISYDIVTQQHGGTIGVESEVGKFTEFTVRLPRARRTSAAARGP